MDQRNHGPGAATSGGRRRSVRVIGVTATIGLLQLAVTPALGAQANNIARAEQPAAANGAIWKSAPARLPQGSGPGPARRQS
ncbi:hypothetical protein ACFFJB_01655 [Camelimonas abortus]|uniref:Uncharacterized protein n=1 Tax=Camelimonas abortus TaxID=1017184 RepID=A0ABV7LH78_9HYPH